MPTTPLPAHQTKVSYICERTFKKELARAAKQREVSMSALITESLKATVFAKKGRK